MNQAIEKCKRIMWRLSILKSKTIRRAELQRAVMLEVGISPQSYINYRNALIKLGWIKTYKRRFLITGSHTMEEY